MRIDRDLAVQMLQRAVRRGADLTEVYMVAARALSAEVKSGQLDALETSTDFGYSVRVIKGGRLGFSYSTAAEDWRGVVDTALESASFTEEDRCLDIPAPAPYPEVGIYDEAVAEISEEDAIERVREIEAGAFNRDGRIRKVRKAAGSFSRSEVLLLNSKGVEARYASTSVTAQLAVVAEDGGDSQMGWGYESSRFIKDVDFSAVGREAAERALRLLGARKASTAKGSVVLESPVASEFLGVLAPSFSSENVQKGKSLLVGRKGQAVVSERVNITDSALLEGRVGSRPFDAEGAPSRENRLVREGRLEGYLYDLYRARKDNTSSTGNAVRSGIYSVPGVGISNLCLEAVSEEFVHPFDDLVRLVERGLLVTEAMGVHTANPISGEFSIGVTGLWIEGGEVAYPVKEAVITGNMLDLFGKVAAVSSNLRFYGRIGVPDLLIEDVDISG